MAGRIYRDENNRVQVDYSPRPAHGLGGGNRPQHSRPRKQHNGPMPEPRLFVGLDLGQANDFSALTVVARSETGFTVPFLDRKRGLPYPELVARIADLLARPEMAGAELIVDATGVGRGVVDMVRGAGLNPIALTIGAGRKATGTRRAPCVPKVDLIEGLLVAFQGRAIEIADTLPHKATLARELGELRRKITAAGNTQYGVWRDGEHDDMILALAMALWAAERRWAGGGIVRITTLDLPDPDPSKDAARAALASFLRRDRDR